MRRLWGGGAVVVAVLVLVACGGQSSSLLAPGFHTSAPVPATGATAQQLTQYMVVDQAGKTVTLRLVAAASGALSGYNFDGYGNGRLKVTIPTGWKATVRCENAGAVPHSCAITRGANDTTPAFPGAATPNPTIGLQKGQRATFSFTPGRPGSYRIACLVPGHMQMGMWDTLTVTASGQPSISVSSPT
jgi:plastocyanin